jgi:hypothetical protein
MSLPSSEASTARAARRTLKVLLPTTYRHISESSILVCPGDGGVGKRCEGQTTNGGKLTCNFLGFGEVHSCPKG